MPKPLIHGGNRGPLQKPNYKKPMAVKMRPYFHLTPASSPIQPNIVNRNSPNFVSSDIAKIYNFPTPVTTPIVIGVISLGGGLYGSVDANGILTGGDCQAYWTSLGITNQPTIVIVSVDGAVNNPAGDLNSSIENTIDVETIGACCPGTNVTILFYIAPNSFAGFYNAFARAINGTVSVNGSNIKPSVISCSWGAPESRFGSSYLTSYNSLFLSAKNSGINICCASGDNGSSDGLTGLNVDFPASSPNVISCGGTNLVCPDLMYNVNTAEKAWTGSGGGLSKTFSSPTYQTNLKQSFRAVPDIALDADPSTGVIYTINQTSYVVGGTSIVSPAVSAFLAAIGSTTFFLPKLYALNSVAFHDILIGNNGGYSAKTGYDYCTGLGSFDGNEIKTELANWVPVSSLSLSASSTSVQIGQTLQIVNAVLPTNSTNVGLGWKSSNTSLATVNASGLITAIKAGSVTITATANDTTNGLKTATYAVNVIATAPVSVASISLPATLSLNVTQTSQLAPQFTPTNATNKSVTWSSANPSVATVSSSGLVTAVGNGSSIITATTVDGAKRATTTVTVQTPVASISLNVGLSKGKSLTLIPTILPSTASVKTLTWTSSNNGLATVSQSGVVLGVALGSVTITATATSGAFASWTITVIA